MLRQDNKDITPSSIRSQRRGPEVGWTSATIKKKKERPIDGVCTHHWLAIGLWGG